MNSNNAHMDPSKDSTTVGPRPELAKAIDETAEYDPFDPANIRVGQDFGSALAVKKVLTAVPCRKPNRHEFIRVRAGEEWRTDTAIFEDKRTRDSYLVAKALWPDLASEITQTYFFLATNRQGDVFLWPVKLPGADGRPNLWNETAIQAARIAETQWTRVASNMTVGMYDTHVAASNLDEPNWPEGYSFRDIIKLCFQSRYIEAADHPVLRALRGES